MQHLRLPRFQYSVRELVSGLCLCGYADEISKTYSFLMAQAVCHHLQLYDVQLHHTHWQTDNATEFLESKEQPGLPSSRYLFIALYVWLEKVLSRGDYRRKPEARAGRRL